MPKWEAAGDKVGNGERERRCLDVLEEALFLSTVSKKKNKSVEASPEKMTRYNLYVFVWAVKIFPNSKYWWKKDLDVIPREQEDLICGFGDNDSNIHPTDKVEVQELHPPPKPASLIYNFEECVGSDDMLGPVGEDQINFDTSNEVFQDRVVMMAIEENISDKKFPETIDAGQLFDLLAVQSSPPPNGIGDQNPHPTDMVEYLEPHPTPKHASLIDNVEGKKIVPLQLNCVNMDLPRSSVKIFTCLKRVSKKGKFRQAPYTPLPATTPITKKRQSKRCKMNFIPMASLDDDDCQIIPLKYWAEDTKPVPRTRKRYNTGYVKKPNTIADYPHSHEITVEPWIKDLSRPPNSQESKVTLPPYFDNICGLPTLTTHIFPWSITGHSVDHEFWLTLLGCRNRGGYLTSLGVPPIEKRDWWKEMRLAFQSVIPTYLDECGVLKAK
ncbi:hypothetical protein Tco_0581342 [Tanacetum coccineum]